MKKIIIIVLLLFVCSQSVLATETTNVAYYKQQIANQHYKYNATSFLSAIQYGNLKIVDCFIKSGFDVNSTVFAVPLSYYAVKCNQKVAFELLLKAGANPDATTVDFNLLLWAIHYKNVEAVKLLVKYNVDVNKEFKNTLPLNKAISTKQDKIVEILLNAGAKPNEKTQQLVAKTKNEMIKYLFSK